LDVSTGFSPGSSEKPFAGLGQFFLLKKKRLQEALFLTLEKRLKTKKLVANNGNSFWKLI
jgi:hypothetical protein